MKIQEETNKDIVKSLLQLNNQMKIQRNHHTFTIEIPEAIDYSIPVVQITIPLNASIDECLEAFQGFLYAAGYRFPEGTKIELEYPDSNE